MKIALYASDHGFGHAARNIPIVKEWLNDCRVTEIFVKTGAAQGEFMKSVLGEHEKIIYDLGPVDIGLILKPNSMDIDATTLENKLRTFIASWDERIQAEIQFLSDNHIDLVVSDIVPWALMAANQANIRSCFVSNFTWVEIYREHLPTDIIETYQAAYKLADYVVLYDLANSYCQAMFETFDQVSLCARDFNLELVEQIQTKFDKPIVFVSVGRSVDLKAKMDVSQLNYQFIVTEGIELEGDNVFYLPKETENTHDYVMASKFVITKAGFGTIAETLLAHKRCGVIGRENVAEDRETISQLVSRNLAVKIELSENGLDFENILSVLETFEPDASIKQFTQDSRRIANKIVEYALASHYVINFDEFGSDESGFLVSLEQVPFDVKRSFLLHGVPKGSVRGAHAYHKTEQVLVCVAGVAHLKCNGVEYLLDNSKKAVYLAPGVWREAYDFSEGAVLLAMCSEGYDPEDYIR